MFDDSMIRICRWTGFINKDYLLAWISVRCHNVVVRVLSHKLEPPVCQSTRGSLQPACSSNLHQKSLKCISPWRTGREPSTKHNKTLKMSFPTFPTVYLTSRPPCFCSHGPTVQARIRGLWGRQKVAQIQRAAGKLQLNWRRFQACPEMGRGTRDVFCLFTRPGKQPHSYGKSLFLMGKLTINGDFP